MGSGNLSEARDRAVPGNRECAVSFCPGGSRPPQFLDAYESTLPGAADRILSLTEREARHRHEMVSQLVSAEVHQTTWVPRYILTLALVTMVFAVVALLVAGTLIAVLDLGGVAGSYLYGIWKSARENGDGADTKGP